MRKSSKWWYGRYKVDGKEFVKNLQVEVRGTRPASLKETGSVHFENSRGEAQAALDKLLEDVHSGKSETRLAEAVYEARAGKKLKRYRIKDLAQIWIEKPRKRPPSEQHSKQVIAKLERLAEFLKANYPKLTRVDQLRPIHINAFLDEREQSGVTAETWNKYLVPIKTVLKRAGVPAAHEILQKETDTVSRKPFTIDELNAIFKTAKNAEPLIYSLAITAACTAMRKKDCCHLRWSDVDLAEGFITVKTSKTGQVVDIPLADILLDEIQKQAGNGSEYVFPKAAHLYKTNANGISYRFKKVLTLAGFDTGNPIPSGELKTDPCTLEELNQAAENKFNGEKLERVKAVLECYMTGKGVKPTAKATGFSPSTVSTYLNELESVTGKAIVRGKRRPSEAVQQPTRGAMRVEREAGKNRASLRDFHSFRTTFVTLALMRGMPLDIVRKITGHKTADVVMKHYFRPERDQLRAAMQKTLPGLLTSAAKPTTPAERAAEVLRKANEKNWHKRISEALGILEETA
ncbi:MAG: tyrosine-type recombinase/integrase [Kiritimatiellales bacterium]|nr:tyrosine-type recombinase/integrase [Kiritimatiellales bacterium]